MARRLKFDIDEAAALYRSGMSLEQVADRCDVSSGTIRRRLLEKGVAMRRPGGLTGAGLDEPEMETLAALYRAGHCLAEISAVTGLSDATVSRRLRAAGVKTRRTGSAKRAIQPLVDVEWCRQMRAEGHSVDEIAGWLGVEPLVVAVQMGPEVEPEAD